MQSTTHSGHVAVIDDDDGFAGSLLALLEAGGFKAKHFPSAEAFIEDDDRYDALFVDWMLPGMSGESLCRQLSEKAGMAKLTLMSGERSCSALSSPLPACVNFIGKPFDPDCLLDTLSAPNNGPSMKERGQP